MELLHILLLVGAIAATAVGESSSTVPRHISKRATRPVGPEFPLHGQIEKILGNAKSSIGDVKNNIEKRALIEKNFFNEEIKKIKTNVTSKKDKEIQQAKGKGKGDERVEDCIKNEHDLFGTDLDEALDQAIKCVESVTETAKKKNDDANHTLLKESLYDPDFKKNLWPKWHSCKPGLNRKTCISEVVSEAMARVKLTADASAKAIKMSKDADKTHAEDVLSCHTTIETNVKERMTERDENVKYCSINPTPWKFNWSL